MGLWKRTNKVFSEINQQGLTYKLISGSDSLYHIYEKLSNGSEKKPIALLFFEEDTPVISVFDERKKSKLGNGLQRYFPPKKETNNREYH